MISEQKLAKAEEGICLLAEALNVTTGQIVECIEHGFNMTAPNSELSDKQKYFLEEMKAIFDCF